MNIKKIYKIARCFLVFSFFIIPINNTYAAVGTSVCEKDFANFESNGLNAKIMHESIKNAMAGITGEVTQIENNIGDKNGQYHNTKEKIDFPLIKTKVDETYKFIDDKMRIVAKGTLANGSTFEEQGYAVDTKVSENSNVIRLEYRRGFTDGFEYLLFIQKKFNTDGSWVASTYITITDSNTSDFASFYGNLTSTGDINGNIKESVIGHAIDTNKNIKTVSNTYSYKSNYTNQKLSVGIGSNIEETNDLDVSINDENGDKTNFSMFSENDTIISCLNKGFDVSQCAIPSFLAKYASCDNDSTCLSNLGSEIIDQDTELADADESSVNHLFGMIDGSTAAAGVLALGAVVGGAYAYRKQDDIPYSEEEFVDNPNKKNMSIDSSAEASSATVEDNKKYEDAVKEYTMKKQGWTEDEYEAKKNTASIYNNTVTPSQAYDIEHKVNQMNKNQNERKNLINYVMQKYNVSYNLARQKVNNSYNKYLEEYNNNN